MAASFSPRTDRGRGFNARRTRPMSEINVTPMVDVMLVLLVIFMVTAPLMATGVQVDLPKTRAMVLKDEDQPIAVTIDKRGRVFVQNSEVPADGLAKKLAAVSRENPDVRIFVRGDQAIPYGQVMAVMGAIYNAGYKKVALVTQPADTPSGRPRQVSSR